MLSSCMSNGSYYSFILEEIYFLSAPNLTHLKSFFSDFLDKLTSLNLNPIGDTLSFYFPIPAEM